MKPALHSAEAMEMSGVPLGDEQRRYAADSAYCQGPSRMDQQKKEKRADIILAWDEL